MNLKSKAKLLLGIMLLTPVLSFGKFVPEVHAFSGAAKAVVGDFGLNSGLLAAVKNGSFERVKELLSQGADANSADCMGTTALHMAVDVENLDIVKELLAHGAYVDSLNYFGMRPLNMAALRGNLGIVNALLGAGADVNASDSMDQTVLHWALMSSKVDILLIGTLLNEGADVTAVSVKGKTALDMAHDRGYHMIEALMKNTRDYC